MRVFLRVVISPLHVRLLVTATFDAKVVEGSVASQDHAVVRFLFVNFFSPKVTIYFF